MFNHKCFHGVHCCLPAGPLVAKTMWVDAVGTSRVTWWGETNQQFVHSYLRPGEPTSNDGNRRETEGAKPSRAKPEARRAKSIELKRDGSEPAEQSRVEPCLATASLAEHSQCLTDGDQRKHISPWPRSRNVKWRLGYPGFGWSAVKCRLTLCEEILVNNYPWEAP